MASHDPRSPLGNEPHSSRTPPPRRVGQRSRSDFSPLYEQYGPRLWAFLATRVPPSDVEEVFQEVWLRALANFETQFDGRSFGPWLFGIARNYVIDRSRKKSPDLLGDQTAGCLTDGAPDPLELALHRERRQALAHCLQGLDATSRELFRARIAGDDYDEICLRLNLTRERAYKLLHQAKVQLHDCVKRVLP